MEEQGIAVINNLKAAIEAILFAAGHPVKYEKLSEVLGIGIKEVKLMTEHMAQYYDDEENASGLCLLNFKETGCCQLCTKAQFAPYIREALGIRKGGNLSASSLEVLAIVAYNQPVTRSFIDTVRGTDSTYATNSLIDKELIESCGRLDAPGRPMLYRTTDKFLRVFGMNSLDELPVAEYLAVPEGEAAKAENGTGENPETNDAQISVDDGNAEVPSEADRSSSDKSSENSDIADKESEEIPE